MSKPVYYRTRNAKSYQENKQHFRPNVNVLETETTFELQVFLPGWDKSDVNVTVEKGFLTIESNKEWTNDNVGLWKHQEFAPKAFKRRFLLPENVLEDQITANAKNGILTIILCKQPVFKKEVMVQ
jgi:HSP20 family protein